MGSMLQCTGDLLEWLTLYVDPCTSAKKPEGKCHMIIYDRRIALLMLGVAFWYLSMFE